MACNKKSEGGKLVKKSTTTKSVSSSANKFKCGGKMKKKCK